MAARHCSLGKYTLLRRLGSGGMAQVFLAQVGGLGRAQREVALKVMHTHLADRPESTELFFREALVASTLDHPNVVTVLDSGEEQGRCFLAMEYVPGLDLRHLLRQVWGQGERLPVGVVLAICAAICAGLHHAHERRDLEGRPLGIVHRDVSPSNVLLSADGAVKVGDFGIAKAVDSWTAMQSATGTIRGKLSYMAPEQARGGEIDRRADVFSVGTVLFEMLAGQRPLRGDGEVEMLHELIFGDVPELGALRSDCDPELVAIVERALARDPEARFATARDLQEALERHALDHGCFVTTSALGEYLAPYCPEPVGPTDPNASIDLDGPRAMTATVSTADLESWSPTGPVRAGARSWRGSSWKVAAGLGLLLAIGAGAAVAAGMVPGSESPSVERSAARNAGGAPSKGEGEGEGEGENEDETEVPSVATERPERVVSASASTGDPQTEPPPEPPVVDERASALAEAVTDADAEPRPPARRSRASRRRKRKPKPAARTDSTLAPGESLFPTAR